MTESTRRYLNWFVLVISVSLIVVNLYDLAQGNSSVAVWVGMVCWPIVAGCTAYEMVTGRRLHI